MRKIPSVGARTAVELSPSSTVAAPPQPDWSCDGRKCPWWPYSSSEDFKANTGLIIVVLFCALICALAFNAAIRYMVHLHCSRRRREDQKAAEEEAQIPAALIYTEGMKLGGAETECIICLSDFSEGEKIRVLQKCNHGFHLHCIQKWLISHASCPTCRTTTNCSSDSIPIPPFAN